jgi:hypothetical protein
MMKKIFFLPLILICLLSCKKELKTKLSDEIANSERQVSKISFSKTLAIALQNEPSLRAFIKNEALKQFDNDYDVLFQLVKDTKLENNKTFYETVSYYASSKVEFDKAVDDIPSLTILVPEVPNFNAQLWDVTKDIPLVAVSPETRGNQSIFIYDSNGKSEKVPFGLIPGFPVVVVKENERISNAAITNKIIVNNSETKLYLADKAFDGSANSAYKINPTAKLQSIGKISRYVEFPLNQTPGAILNDNTIDKASIDAYNLNLDWHRDYIYYGLNPAAGINKGKFNTDYQEYIVSIKLLDNQYDKISEHPSDPKATDEFYFAGSGRPGSVPYPTQPELWTNGNYDLRISILINAKNGGGNQLEKIFSIRPYDLFDLTYQKDGNSTRFYRIAATPKICYLNEPIVAWDLENYGSQWKFVVKEFDPTTETTLSYTNTSQFATNFGFDAGFGEKVKLGIKFGATLTTTNSNTYQVKVTTGSNDLGEGILDFSNPIILNKETYLYTPPRGTPYNKERYVTNDVSTGSVLISVEPKKYRNI